MTGRFYFPAAHARVFAAPIASRNFDSPGEKKLVGASLQYPAVEAMQILKCWLDRVAAFIVLDFARRRVTPKLPLEIVPRVADCEAYQQFIRPRIALEPETFSGFEAGERQRKTCPHGFF